MAWAVPLHRDGVGRPGQPALDGSEPGRGGDEGRSYYQVAGWVESVAGLGQSGVKSVHYRVRGETGPGPVKHDGEGGGRLANPRTVIGN